MSINDINVNKGDIFSNGQPNDGSDRIRKGVISVTLNREGIGKLA